MAFLGRRNSFAAAQDREEDYEDDEIEEKPRRRRPRGRDFKDLKPENRKRRKEPKKPWGKKERLLVLLILFLTVGGSGILALSSREWKLPGLPRLAMPSFSIPFLGEETIILEGGSDSQVVQQKAKEAVSSFKEKTQNLTGVYGFYFVDLNSSFSYGVNEKEVFQAASLIKLPVIVGVYMESEAGNINLDEKYTLKSGDKVGGAGSLYGKPVGYQITYRNLVQLMGKQSDNTAFNISRNLLGEEKINEVITKIGMKKTSLAENETTPEDIGIFFEQLWRGNLVNDESKEEILNSLTDTIYEDWLAAGIPDDIRVAHKYGRELHVVNDAGIVFSERPFVIVLMSKGIADTEADEIFPELARIVYEAEIGNY